jgi:hypothetical protein
MEEGGIQSERRMFSHSLALKMEDGSLPASEWGWPMKTEEDSLVIVIKDMETLVLQVHELSSVYSLNES